MTHAAGGERLVSAARRIMAAAARGRGDLLGLRTPAAYDGGLARFGNRRRVVRPGGAFVGRRRRSRPAALGAHQALVTWLPGFDFGLLLDPLSLLWTFIITGVGFLIVFYSVGYMEGDRATRDSSPT